MDSTRGDERAPQGGAGGGGGGLTNSQDSSDIVFTRIWPCESPDSGAGGQLSITLMGRTTHATRHKRETGRKARVRCRRKRDRSASRVRKLPLLPYYEGEKCPSRALWHWRQALRQQLWRYADTCSQQLLRGTIENRTKFCW